MNAISIEERLEANRGHMSPAALRVGRFLVDHPERALLATAAEIAEAARTSNATVVRAVRTLGYAGLPGLRREVGERLADHYDRRVTMEERFARVKDDPRSVLDSVLHDAADLLTEMRSVDHDEFLSSVELVAHADSIFVIGWGSAAGLAEYAALGLNRLGCPATSVTQSGFLLADSLSRVRAGSVILLLAPLLHVSEIDVVLARASTVGAHCVLVTEVLGEKLRGMVDHVLTMPSSLRFTVSEILAPSVVLDALLLGVAVSKPDRARSTWEVINGLRGAFSTGSVVRPQLSSGSSNTGGE
jgi:DNA-binding MurR/RpiR family transcriptional regulator